MTNKIRKARECHWSQDGEDSDTWATQCSHYFTLIEGTPGDNHMRFCCYCGRPLVQLVFEDEVSVGVEK